MFFALELILGGTKCIGSNFHVLRSRNRFTRYRGHQIFFSCFALYDLFSAVPRATCPVFMFFAPVLIFVGAVGAESSFHILCSKTRF
jgi:hypothetical protein